VAITAQREGKGKGTATMREICDEESRPLSIDEEPGQKQTNQALKVIVADMPPAEGTIRPDLDSTNEEAQAETTTTGTKFFCYVCKLQGHRQEECRK
jgi:hypothetical protein